VEFKFLAVPVLGASCMLMLAACISGGFCSICLCFAKRSQHAIIYFFHLAVVKVDSECLCEIHGTFSMCEENNNEKCKCKPGFGSDEPSKMHCEGDCIFLPKFIEISLQIIWHILRQISTSVQVQKSHMIALTSPRSRILRSYYCKCPRQWSARV